MADRLIDLAFCLFNAALTAFAAFALCVALEGRRGRVTRWLGIGFDDYNTGLLVVVLIAAIVGFIWGDRLWRSRDPWTRLPRK